MTIVKSEELWEEVDCLQVWADELRSDPADFFLLQETAEELGETLATLHALSRQEW